MTRKNDPKNPEIVSEDVLKEVRIDEVAAKLPIGKKGNVFINTLNLFAGPVRGLVDPIHRICYEPIRTHYDRKYRQRFPEHHGKVLILDIVLMFMLGGLAVTAIFLKFLLPVFSPPAIVTLNAQFRTEPISGKATELVVSYRNEGEQPLADSVLEIRMPPSFVPDESEPETDRPAAGFNGETVRTVRIGTIPANGQGETVISGRFYSPTGSRNTVTVSASFWRAGDTAPKRTAQNMTWSTSDSLFRLAIRPEEGIVRGRRVTISLPYANLDERGVLALIRLTPPDDFVVTGSFPARTATNEWDLGRLDPGQKGNIEIYGHFRSGSARPAVPHFVASAYIMEGGERRLAEEIRRDIETLSGGFEIEQSLTEPSGASAVSPGNPIRLTIRYGNTGQEPLGNVTVRLKTDAEFLEGDPTLVWTADTNPELRILDPGTSGSLSFEGRLKADIAPKTRTRPEKPTLELRTEAEYFLSDDRTRPAVAETSSVSLPISTTLSLKAAALYWTRDGDQIGSGPFPPEIGRATKYRVFIRIGNDLNRTEETEFTAFLPTGAEWTGNYSVTIGKPPAFLPAERRLIWNIGDLPADDLQAGIGASFEIALTPTETTIFPAVLMRDLKLCGRDSFTGARVCADAEPAVAAIE
ncbi:hypothetical protein JW899_00375 [Candidatus Uhrbacteria bacterium]|nr:hypothetical protein [Candidatus Uhrbacteria bacterium]